MAKNKKIDTVAIIIHIILSCLLVIILLNFCIHAVRTKRFNSRIHSLTNVQESNDIDVFGRMTGEWPKGDALVPGVTNGCTYEITVSSTADFPIDNWSLRLNINKECYLNQAWNGKVEIHQNVKNGNEKVDILDLHNFEIDYENLNIASRGKGKNNLMIHLNEGDYLIYHPLRDNFIQEYPLKGANNSVTVGVIFYYYRTFTEPDYLITYQFGKSILHGTEFVIFVVLSLLWILIFSGALVWTIVRKKAEKDLAEREAMLEETMGLITSFVDAKDSYTNGHSNRVAEYTTMIAEKLNLPDREVRYAYYAAVLHDVGKCYVPDEILKKPGRLTDEEFDTIKKHTTYGGEMLKSIKTIKYISDGAKYHHERYDGKGYPEGLCGERIPFIGRIICVADAFDAMTSSRCYRPALSKEYVINEIKNNLGKQFDPSAGQAMLSLIDENKMKIEGWEKADTDC